MNNGILKKTKTYLFVFIMTLLVSASNISYAKVNVNHMNGNGVNFSKKMHVPTTISKISTGIFRGSRATVNRKAFRVDNAPYPYVGRGIGKRPPKKQNNKRGRTRVRLSANLPRGLGIKNADVEWQITSVKGKSAARMKGSSATVRLSPGVYNIRLRVGSYKKTQQVTIRKSRNNAQSIPITTRLGLLNVSSSLNGSNKNTRKIRWTAKNKHGKIIARGRGNRFRTLVPAGRYKVEAHYDNAKEGKNILVQQGSVGRGVIKLPAGSIKISAYKNSIREPIFSPTTWTIYDKNGKPVAKSKKHNFRVTLFPGKYRAKLKAKGKITEKRFVVSSGRNAEVNVIVK